MRNCGGAADGRIRKALSKRVTFEQRPKESKEANEVCPKCPKAFHSKVTASAKAQRWECVWDIQ